MLKLACLSVFMCLWQSKVSLVTGQNCHIPTLTNQAAPNQPAIRFTTSPVREQGGLLNNKTVFEDKFFTVKECVLTLYLKSTVIRLFGFKFDLAGDPITCYKSDSSSQQKRTVVATGTVLKFQRSAVDRPEVVPASWYEGERAVIKITYNTFPKDPEERMTCELAVDVLFFTTRLLTDVNTTAVGCPHSHWGTECQNVCPCQNGGRCVGTFSARCRCPIGTSGDHCQNVTASQNSPRPSVSRAGPVSPNLTSPDLPSHTPTPGLAANRSLSDVTLQVTSNTTEQQGNGLLDQCHLPSRTRMSVNEDEDALQFSFHPVSVNRRAFPDLRVEDHQYEVRQCQLTVWMRSSPLILKSSLRSVTLAGQSVMCHSGDPSQTVGEVSVLSYMGDVVSPRPDALPADWYNGNRVVLQMRVLSFPSHSNTSLKMTCPYRHSLTTLTIEWGLDIWAVGCPVRKWGTHCQNDCLCRNNNCHTFSGRCFGDPPEMTSHRPEPTSRANSRPLGSFLFHTSIFLLLALIRL